jgi:hypothetical protein
VYVCFSFSCYFSSFSLPYFLVNILDILDIQHTAMSANLSAEKCFNFAVNMKA